VVRTTGIPSDLRPTPPHRGRNTNTGHAGGWTGAAGGGGWVVAIAGRCSIYGACFVVIIKSLGLGGRNVHFLRSDGSAFVGFLRWPTSVSQTNGAADMISTGIRSIPVRLVLFFACHAACSRLHIGTTKRRLGGHGASFSQFICSLNWKDIPIGCEMAKAQAERHVKGGKGQ
jgi:hypothetical protein